MGVLQNKIDFVAFAAVTMANPEDYQLVPEPLDGLESEILDGV